MCGCETLGPGPCGHVKEPGRGGMRLLGPECQNTHCPTTCRGCVGVPGDLLFCLSIGTHLGLSLEAVPVAGNLSVCGQVHTAREEIRT